MERRERYPEPIERSALLDDVRTLARKNMSHRDLAGLADLMDDYLALGDELEEVTPTSDMLKAARANDGDTIPASLPVPASTTRAA